MKNILGKFVANCGVGLEDLVGDEISSFGGNNIEKKKGVVLWDGPLETAYKACLWSRFTSKILYQIDAFNIKNDDELYEQTKKISWEKHLSSSHTFSVSSAVTSDAVIPHSHFAALRVKDAIVDYFREKENTRPDIAKYKPDIRIHFFLEKNEAVIFLDMSGESLHRRGYREATGAAPLKETLGAAIVAFSGWSNELGPETTLIDPMCGSGTLLIEAALIWGDSAPGLSRKYFGFSKWLGHMNDIWSLLVDEAIEREEKGLKRKWPKILGFDCDYELVKIARKNIERAGLEEFIDIQHREIAHLDNTDESGFIISNLPYGERLLEEEDVPFLYRGVGRIVSTYFTGWNISFFISVPELVDNLGLNIQKSYKLKNGPLSCRLVCGHPKKTPDPFEWRLNTNPVTLENSDLANRLKKNFKKLSKWSRKNNISCFRLYDKDLAEYNVAIDIYEKYLLLQEYKAPSSIDPEVAKKRFTHVLDTIKSVFEIGRDRIYIRERKRQKGKKQYQAKEGRRKYFSVREGNCFFLVNFTNYLDTGLFLDHRPIRMEIGKLAEGKSFLNLFGYTGTASVHAAMGGAKTTTTVDLSATYMNWARMNMANNGLSLDNNIMIKEDCLSWLKSHKGKYDLIFVDPPTFSNTKKKDRVFDIQKDHSELLLKASELLEKKNGLLIFSTNYRGFTLDKLLEKHYYISDITNKTIPHDFSRSKRIHRCYMMRIKAENGL